MAEPGVVPRVPAPRRGTLLILAINALLIASAIVAVEAWLERHDPPASVRYSVYPPDQITRVRVDPRVTPGVTGDAEFHINAVGTRGPLPSASDAVRILAIGGSTTECFVLSLEESWPWRVGSLLEARTGKKTWVGNIGRAGRHARQHYFDAAYVAPQFEPVDIALLLVGVNDLFNRMIQGRAFEREDVLALEAQGDYIAEALHISESADPWVGRFALARRARRALEALALLSPRRREVNRLLSHTLPDFYVESRRMRASRGATIDALPPMDAPLEEFERNITLIIARLRANGTRPVLITQPSLWKPEMPVVEDRLCWLGSADGWPPRREGGAYYSTGAMGSMLVMYNDALRRIARSEDVLLIDLADRVPPDLSTFYDDIHFNESGAAAVAEVVAQALVESAVGKR